MINFKEFFYESLSVENDKIIFDYSQNEVGIKTKMGKNKFKAFESKAKILMGATLYFLYKLTSKESNIVSSLKNNSPYFVDVDDLTKFIKRSALYANKNLKNVDFDIIIYPDNAKDFLLQFIEQFSKLNGTTKFNVKNSIRKTNPDNIKIYDPKNKLDDKSRKSLERGINKAKTRGHLKLHKDLPVMLRQYVKNFIEIDKQLLKKIDGKNILIIDDVYTGGNTMKELIEILNNNGANNITGLTLFKIGS